MVPVKGHADRLGRLPTVVLAFAIASCGHAPIDSKRLEATATAVTKARRTGAYRCAPRELALAQAHLDFARVEIAQGNVARAGVHLAEAELNADAAQHLSPPGRCRGGTVGGFPSGLLAPQPRDNDRDGDGVPDRVDLCPDTAEDIDGHVDRDGCIDADNDRDGVPDTTDRCPDEAEDKDGFEDEDGCPEPDNDQDGLSDGEDACPDVAGEASEGGCPALKYEGIELTSTDIRIENKIVFEPNTALIRSVSFPTLDAIAKLLADRPRITLEIEGHTDSRGTEEKNLEDSRNRAEAVRNALIQRGVDGTRLTARGYGETRPIESNRTSQGRAINLRIEFKRTDARP
ncbi:MAG: OmpA family protein [Myxococcales bacterium]|nr:OmpA family protein [Myxococcales bacterium]